VTSTKPRRRTPATNVGAGGWGGPHGVTLVPPAGPVHEPASPLRRAAHRARTPNQTADNRVTAASPGSTRLHPRAAPAAPSGGPPDLAAAGVLSEVRLPPARPVRHVLLVLWLGSLLVAAVDLATSRSFAYGSEAPIHTASVVKLDVLETLLLQAQDAGRRLTPETARLATQMMENSDNDATTRLWGVVGGAEAVAAANIRLGAHATHLDDEHWGTSTTCAADQVALLGALARPGPLGTAARSFATGLLTHVEDDQRWGISAAADPGAATGLKNGWLPLDDDSGSWIVNSVGVTTVAHQPVLLAVLTEHQPSEEAGIGLVEAVARAAARAVVTGMLPSTPTDAPTDVTRAVQAAGGG